VWKDDWRWRACACHVPRIAKSMLGSKGQLIAARSYKGLLESFAENRDPY
jgi:hypothetical protein